jgi:hypothetical protein
MIPLLPTETVHSLCIVVILPLEERAVVRDYPNSWKRVRVFYRINTHFADRYSIRVDSV